MVTKKNRVAIVIYILIFSVIFQSCHSIGKTLTERSVKVDSVAVDVVTPEVTGNADMPIGTEGMYEDDRIRLNFKRIPAPDSLKDGRHEMGIMPSVYNDSTNVEMMPGLLDWFQLDYTIKPDTVKVMVPQKTITEKTETTKYVKQMPNWGWILVGGLGAILLVLLAGAKLMK